VPRITDSLAARGLLRSGATAFLNREEAYDPFGKTLPSFALGMFAEAGENVFQRLEDVSALLVRPHAGECP
jgi:hypothetical protein